MSGVLGMETLFARFDAYQAAIQARMDDAVEAGARQMQRDMAALVRVRSGRLRAEIESEDAVQISTVAGRRLARVGFLTDRQKRYGFRGYFLEFGTKGYEPGSTRAAGKDKHGRARTRKVSRRIPAHPANPFFRPALAMLRANMGRLRAEAHRAALRDAGQAAVVGAVRQVLVGA